MPQRTIFAFIPRVPIQCRRVAPKLGTSMLIKGHIHSGEDLTIEGEVEGTIDIPAHRLTIASTATVRADMITAKEVVVLGSLTGKVAASEKVFIRKGAALT